MPLRDHFHGPVFDEAQWEGIHSMWTSMIVRHLNSVQLPARYRAIGQVHAGTQVEIDIAAFEEDRPQANTSGAGNGIPLAVWAPPEPVQTLATEFPAQDLFEVRIHDDQRGRRLVAAIELVSPGNKAGPENRRAFAVKCASYLQQRVSVVILDVVTEKHFNLHRELLEVLGQENVPSRIDDTHVYAVAYRTMKEQKHWRLDLWPHALTLGAALPTVPLWLAGDLAVPLLLEETYEETCSVLRIP
jgi:hypothetical protein